MTKKTVAKIYMLKCKTCAHNWQIKALINDDTNRSYIDLIRYTTNKILTNNMEETRIVIRVEDDL
jgi:hypothetical protein